MKNKRAVKIFLLSFLLLFLYGCNKQKAEAIKVAAEKFRNEAILGIDQLNTLFLRNISLVLNETELVETILNDLKSLDDPSQINAELLDFWSDEVTIGTAATESTNQKFEELKAQYYQFEAIFSSIEKGNALNAKSVKQAEKYVIKLTVQLINFANIINENTFRYTAKRVLIIEKMKTAKSEQNQELQEELLKNVAKEFVELRAEEDKAKETAIKQCLKAADSGKMLAELIRNYDKLSVNDIMVSVRNAMNYAAQISGGNEKVTNLLEKFNTVENSIQQDPYWKIILEQNVN